MPLILTGSDSYSIRATVNGVKKVVRIKYGQDVEKLGLSDDDLNFLVHETIKTKKGRVYRFTYLEEELPEKPAERHSGGVIGRKAMETQTKNVEDEVSEPSVIVVEEPAVEEPAVEEPATEDVVAEDVTAVEEPAAEDVTAVEEPAAEEVVAVESKVEAPAKKPAPKKKTAAKKTAAKKSTAKKKTTKKSPKKTS